MKSLVFCGILAVLAADAARAEETTDIRLNTVGYLPGAAKKASIAVRCSGFAVVRVTGGARVFGGTVTGPQRNRDTGEELFTADFTALQEPGDYRLEVKGAGTSAPFRIAADVYDRPFRVAVRAMYLWRCGIAVSGEHEGQTFAHGPCHLEDAYLDHVGGDHQKRDGTGGWHDAGDYNKYVVNAGVTVGAMLRAWEDFGSRIRGVPLDLPESGGPLPDFLAEVRWEIDWLLKMQAPDGSVYHKLSTRKFGGFVLPEKEKTERYFTPWGSAATASFVAVTAAGARAFRPHEPELADRCLEAARKSYAFLGAHPEQHSPDQSGFSTGRYGSPDRDDRLWAAAELWETTGDGGALRDFESRARAMRSGVDVDVDFDWGNVKNLALFTYVRSQRRGRDEALVARIRESLLATADRIVETCRRHGYARPLGDRYYWGCNGGVARQTLVLETAHRMAPKAAYRETELDALSHLLGRNVYGRSFVTGLGFRPPLRPHDRRSGGDAVDAPWPGYVVGGANPRATSWRDDQGDYRTNETAINWNGALIYALAAFTAGTSGAPVASP